MNTLYVQKVNKKDINKYSYFYYFRKSNGRVICVVSNSSFDFIEGDVISFYLFIDGASPRWLGYGDYIGEDEPKEQVSAYYI